MHTSLEQPLLTEGPGHMCTISYRPLQPDDFLAVKAAHASLFPIDYDDGFFHKATNALDRIWSCAAFSVGPYGEEKLVGFITAKTVFLHECEATDRQHMGLLSPIVDHDLILYILTLGVLEGYRHQGIASNLIHNVCQHAADTRCRAVFLHVIHYNTAAMALYSRQGFACVARLGNFYYISTGRQPDPSTCVYDAYLYVQYIVEGAGLATPWDLVTLAMSPLRSALGRIHSCMPGFCRQQQVHQHPASPGSFPDAAAEPSRSSSSSNSCSYQQLQPQQLPQPPPYSRQFIRRSISSQSSSSGLMKQQPQHMEQMSPGQQGMHLQQQQQQTVQMQQYPQHHLQQQQQHPQHWHSIHHGHQHQHRLLLHHHQQQHQRPHPPPQRMLRWLFNAQSRAGLTAQQGQQLQQRASSGVQQSGDGQLQHAQPMQVL